MSNTVRELVGGIPRQFAEVYRLGFVTSTDEVADRLDDWQVWLAMPFAVLIMIVVPATTFIGIYAISETAVGNHQLIVWVVEGIAFIVKWWMWATVAAALTIQAKILWAVFRGIDD